MTGVFSQSSKSTTGEPGTTIVIELINPLQQKAIQSWKFNLSAESISIGRSRQKDIPLVSAVVSRDHAILKRDVKGWHVEAVGANGCFIDGQAVEKAYLRNGTVFRVAKTGPYLRFTFDASASEPDKSGRQKKSTLRTDDTLSARETWLGGDKNA